MLRLLSFCATSLLVAAPAAAQQFAISPSPVVRSGDPVTISLTGLAPGAKVEIVAERWWWGWPNSSLHRSTATYTVDPAGRVNLTTAAPLSGSYTGADAAGLFWSMAAVAGERADRTLDDVTLVAKMNGRVVTTAKVTFQRRHPSLIERPVQGFPGAILHRLPGAERLPIIIVVGGSEGGSPAYLGRKFAAYGYAAVSMPYHSPKWRESQEIPELSPDFADIPVDRIGDMKKWIGSQADLDSGRIGMWGVSKGGEYAMLAATKYPWLKAVVGIVPSDVVWEGWGPGVTQDDSRSSFSWRGRPLPFVPYLGMREMLKRAATHGISFRIPQDAGRRAHPERAVAARIPVERYKGAMLVAGGGLDKSWDSAGMSLNIVERRAEAGLKTKLLAFSEADHFLTGDGWEPTASAPNPAANARAQAEIWKATLELSDRYLRGDGGKK